MTQATIHRNATRLRIFLSAVVIFACFITSAAHAQKLNVSYDELMKTLSEGFVMQEIPLKGGKKTFRGATPDGFALLEAIGDKRNIEEASIILGVPKDRPEVYKRNAYVLDVFLLNLGVKAESSTWVAGAMNNLAKAKKLAQEEKTFKGKKITVQQAPNFGYKITIKAVADSPKSKDAKGSVSTSDKNPPANPLAVTGIVGGGKKDAVAIIGGKMYKQEDAVNGLTIQTIGPDYIDFVDGEGQLSRQELGK